MFQRLPNGRPACDVVEGFGKGEAMPRTYRTIDSDGHVTEPPDLWEKYIDPAFRDHAPRFVSNDDGSECILVEDIVRHFARGYAGATCFGKPPIGRYQEGVQGGFDPHLRIPDMDADGIDAAFLYPSMSLQFINFVKDDKLAGAICRAYNRWLADYCSAYPDRLFGVAMLPMQSIEVAIAEADFARSELGMTAGFLRPNPCHDRTIYDRAYDPVWAAVQDLDLAIGLHEGTGAGVPSLAHDRFESTAAKHVASHTFEMMAACAGLIMTGVCERFPGVRFGFLESGGGWVAPWLDRMDRHVHGPLDDTGLRLRPSDYFRRQCWISFEPVEHSLSVLADYIGPENILWATDYPHTDGFPDAVGLMRSLGMAPATERRVLAEGAIRFYGMGDPAQLMDA
jgi:predicted TIM-barrel fold metal-dependent hydrolase